MKRYSPTKLELIIEQGFGRIDNIIELACEDLEDMNRERELKKVNNSMIEAMAARDQAPLGVLMREAALMQQAGAMSFSSRGSLQGMLGAGLWAS